MLVRCRDSLCLLLAMCFISASAGGAEVDAEKVCAKAVQVPLPDQDRPTAAQRKSLENCDAEDLYYGITRPADMAAGRLCAYSQLGTDQDGIYAGAGILMMIYANAAGVPRNLDLARRFVCEYGGAEAETQNRLEYLDSVQARHVAPKQWDLCDDITSGLMDGYCTAHEERFQDRERTRALAQITSPWLPAERAAFEKLRLAADAFFALHAASEIDLSGTSRAAFSIAEEAAMKQTFIDELRQWERGKLPTGSTEDYRQADAALNASYRQLMKADLSESTLTAKGVRETQRAWLKYRDAWVEFAAVKYPQVAADAWRTALTRAREAALRKIYRDFAAG